VQRKTKKTVFHSSEEEKISRIIIHNTHIYRYKRKKEKDANVE